MEQTRPFNQLSEEDQRAAVDIGVALSVLLTRVPTISKPLFDYVTVEWANSQGLPRNVAKYALRELGANLFNHDWEFTITKTSSKLTTQFKPVQTGGGGNGEIVIN